MTADEMFEELGALKTETIDFITYSGKEYSVARVLFDKKRKCIVLEKFNAIDVELLQAINQKCKELGWI